MTTPPPTVEERVSTLETRLETVLPTLATKEDIARLEGMMNAMEERLGGRINATEGRMDANNERLEGKMNAMEKRLEGRMNVNNERLEGKMDAMNERLEGKMNAMGYQLLIRFTGVMAAVAAIAVAAARFL